MARTGSSTVGSTSTRVFQSDRNNQGKAADGEPARAFQVNCDSASAVSLMARIPSVTGADFITIAAGQSRQIVTVGTGSNRPPTGDELYLKGNSGTATYTWEAIA